MPGKSVYINFRDVSCIFQSWSRLSAKNLNDFNIHFFGKTVHYSVSLPLNVPFDHMRTKESPQFQVVPHFRYISDISSSHRKNKNLILTLVQQHESFDSDLFQGKQLSTTETTINSWELWFLCKRFPNFYRK